MERGYSATLNSGYSATPYKGQPSRSHAIDNPDLASTFSTRTLELCEFNDEFCYHEAFEIQKKCVHKIRGQHGQHEIRLTDHD